MEPQPQTDRFQAANEIFAAALGLPAGERSRFVQSRCSSDPTIQQSVLRLLGKFDQLGDFLEEPAYPSLTELQPGEILAERFHIVRKIGCGGMGEVYQAADRVLGESVAVKTIRSDFRDDPEVEARFRDEIRLARKIAHPNICRTFDVFSGTRDGVPFLFFTMEFLEGETLASKLKIEQRLSRAATLAIASQIAAGLDAAHRQGIVHRDLKPANIMLVPGAAGRAVITDFGLARPFDTAVPAGMTQTGQLIGSPQYMAPEQFLGNGFTASADIYTFGLIVFETIAGQRPFPDENIVRAAIRRTSVDAPPISSVSSEVPASWDRILGRALSRDPAERPALAADIVRDLERAGPYSRAPSRRTLIFTAAGASAVASFAVFLRFNPWRDVQPPAAPIIMFADATPPGPEGETAAGLITLLQKQLDRSPISVLSRGRIEQAWRRMHSDGLALPAVLQSRDAREVALRAGANLVAFTGATRRLDEWTFWLRVEMLGPTPAAPLTYWEKDFKTAVEGDRFTVSTKAADWLAKIAGASHGPEAGRVRTPQELTTSNWEALVEYSDADDAWAHNESDAAVRHLKTALDLDPEFALAAGRMADILTSLGRIDEGLQYYGSAAELVRSKNLTDRESLRIRGIYALDTAQWNTGEEVFSRWIIEYPKDPVPLIYKAVALERLGRIEQSLHVLDMAVALRPGYNSSLSCRALMLLRAGRFDDAARDLAALAKLGPLNLAGQIGGALAFARLDLAGAWQALDDMSRRGDASSQSSAFALKACFRAEQGRPPDAATLLNDGIRFDREHGLAAGELTKRRLLAQLSIATGRLDDARKLCRQVLDTRPGHAVAMEFGSLLARAGDLPGARAALPQNLPDLPVYGYWAARLRAEIALASDDARKATDLLIAAPDNPTSGIWPEYLVRAAHAAGAHAVVKQWVNALAANPAGYWFAADGTGPGFICWALQKFDSEIDSDLQPRAAALRQALSQFK